MSAADHDGSTCPECGGLLDVETLETPRYDGRGPPATIRRSRCEECGHRTEEYL